MPSTLHVFRKHQKVLMVMTTGLAMISFVILGAVNARPENMPAVLVVLALAAMFGGAAWVIGQVNGKSSEYVTIGTVAGAVLGLWLSWGRQDPSAIQMSSGNLTGQQVFAMKRERNLVNQFVGEAYQRVNGFQAQFAEQFGQRVFFHYTPGAWDSDLEMAITALLQREAEKLGIGVSAQGVFEFIRGLAMTSGKSLTQEQFSEIRTRMGISEEALIAALADELKARRAYDLLYNQRPMPTPEALYEYYKKLNVTEEAEIAVLPVSDFVDEKAEPTTKELEELFAKHKSNPPGYGPDGKFVEGLPGFRQPPRMKLAYLEAPYDAFEKQVGEVTDKEIEARYEELKKRPFGDADDVPDFGSLPAIPPGGLPNALEGVLPNSLKPPTVPPTVPPTDGVTPPAAPQEGAKPETTAPAAPPAPMPEAPKAEAPKPDAPKVETPATPPAAPPVTTPETPKADAPKADAPAPPASPEAAPPAPAPEKAPEPAPPADKPSTMLPNVSRLSFVAFQDEQPPAPPVANTEGAAPATPPAAPKPDAVTPEAPKVDAPKAETPKSEAPKVEPTTPETPKSEPAKPETPKADPAAPSATPPADGAPTTSTPTLPPPVTPGLEGVTPPADPPLPTVRPLDDAYRAELKQEILRERAQALMEKKMEAATQWFAEEVGALVNTPPGDASHLTPEAASKKLKDYAAKNGLVYVDAPLLSFQELRDSEDYPVGSAAAVNHPQKAEVATDVFENFGRSMNFMPRPAAGLDANGQGSRFLYWITGDRQDYEPESLEDPIVKEQVVKTWRQLRARAKAEERAAELVKLAKAADKPLTEVFAEQSVTGKEGTGYISVRPTGKFSWYRMPVVPTRSMQREAAPTLTELPGLKPLGNEFFTTVFEKMKAGDLGTTTSADKSEFYVVKIVNRTPSTPEELEAFRQTFLTRGLSNEYFDLASRDWAMYGKNRLDELLKENNVQFSRPNPNEPDRG